jgi:hypothetical protein
VGGPRDANWLGPAIHPGELLLEEYLKPMRIGQVVVINQSRALPGYRGQSP